MRAEHTGPYTYLNIHVAHLTLTQQVGAAAGQSGVNNTPTGLDDLREECGEGKFVFISLYEASKSDQFSAV